MHADIYGIVATNSTLHSELLDRIAALPTTQRLAGWIEHRDR
jgi:hypothetical protein